MKLTILGSGSWWAQAERMGPAFLIEHAGFRALVDCGEGCLRRLAGAGVEPSSLNAILLTHDHPDHIAGLLPLLVGLHVQKMMGHPAARTEAMAFIGPPRIDRLLALLPELGDPGVISDGVPLLPRILTPPETFDLGPFVVQAVPVKHKEHAMGFRFKADGKVIAFSGDSGPCDTLAEIAKNADVFVCEAGTSKGYPAHLTPEQAAQAAHDGRAKKLILTHIPGDADTADFQRRAKSAFDGEVVIGEDLMVVNLG